MRFEVREGFVEKFDAAAEGSWVGKREDHIECRAGVLGSGLVAILGDAGTHLWYRDLLWLVKERGECVGSGRLYG